MNTSFCFLLDRIRLLSKLQNSFKPFLNEQWNFKCEIQPSLVNPSLTLRLKLKRAQRTKLPAEPEFRVAVLRFGLDFSDSCSVPSPLTRFRCAGADGNGNFAAVIGVVDHRVSRRDVECGRTISAQVGGPTVLRNPRRLCRGRGPRQFGVPNAHTDVPQTLGQRYQLGRTEWVHHD